MPASPIRRAFFAGFRAGLPFLLVIIPFALVFGVAAAEAGWSVTQIVGMSVGVVAGASQFTALQLVADQAPVLVVIATSLAVNLRMAMYSASLAPHIGGAKLWQRAFAAYLLTDQSYGTAMNGYALRPYPTPSEKVAFLVGAAAPVCPPWYAATYVGAVAGGTIPPAFALDFAVPITFIALVAPALRSLPHLAAAFVSVAASLALHWLPFNLWLLSAASLAMMSGAGVELWQERRR